MAPEPLLAETPLASPRRETSSRGFERRATGEATEKWLEEQIETLADREKDLAKNLENIRTLWASMLRPLADELAFVQSECAQQTMELELLHQADVDAASAPPGPACLYFVDGPVFSIASSAIIVVNLCIMFMELVDSSVARSFWAADQAFLVWYVTELVLRALLHRQGLLLGKFSTVWWNWLDFLIVLSGVLDQWVAPLVRDAEPASNSSGPASWLNLKMLRCLRIFRVLRILKIVRIFLESDLSWTEGGPFQKFIMAVIIFNSIAMGFELDVPWGGWVYMENGLLVIYLFELSVRMKRWRCHFFVHPDDCAWNNVDFVIVFGGVLQQWVLPGALLLQKILTGTESKPSGAAAAVMKLLRMMRLLRVMRLARLLRNIKPLYRLMIGVLEAMQGLQWVIVLAAILLYACAIVFTNLIGHGLIYGSDPPIEAEQRFGTVPESMFMLFKVMNDDQSVVSPLLESLPVKLLFVMFMVISNWAVLAILTSVVSDNMISASHFIEQEEMRLELEQQVANSHERLVTIFGELDEDGSGSLDDSEFKHMLRDEHLARQLCDASGLKVQDLEDLFLCLSHPDKETGTHSIKYRDFIDKLQDESKDASERSVFRLEKSVQMMEMRIDTRIDTVLAALGLSVEEICQMRDADSPL